MFNITFESKVVRQSTCQRHSTSNRQHFDVVLLSILTGKSKGSPWTVLSFVSQIAAELRSQAVGGQEDERSDADADADTDTDAGAGADAYQRQCSKLISSGIHVGRGSMKERGALANLSGSLPTLK